MSERDLQIETASLLKRLGWLAWHTPNEARAKQRRLEGARLGVLAGVPDWIILEPWMDADAGRAGLGIAVELKVGRNKTTPEQDRVLKQLTARGFLTCVCRSMSEFQRVLRYVNPRNGRRLA